MLSQRLLASLEEMAMDADEVPETGLSRAVRIIFEEQGEARGEANGRRESLLRVFAARGLTPTKEERALIGVLTDIAVLDHCVQAAVTAASVEAVFARVWRAYRRRTARARSLRRRDVKKPSSRR
jgi:hypothetical protein